MAEMAVADGFATVVVTPHQLGSYAHNDGDTIRQRTGELQQQLDGHGIPLRVLPGADVRIDEPLLAGIRAGQVLTLADHRKHVLLELPHETLFPAGHSVKQPGGGRRRGCLVAPGAEPGTAEGASGDRPAGGTGVPDASHFEQSDGDFWPYLPADGRVDVQPGPRPFPRHGRARHKSRRPLIRRAFEHVVQLVDEDTAREVCCRNPAAVAAGQTVEIRRRRPRKARTIGLVALAEGGVNCGRSPLTRPSLSLWRQHSSRRPRLLLHERPKTGRTSGR